MLTQARLKQVLDYDQDAGIFVWRTAPNGRIKVGQTAGSMSRSGLLYVKIDGVSYVAARLAILWTKGRWPKEVVRHTPVTKVTPKAPELVEGTKTMRAQNRARIDKGITKEGRKWRASVWVKSLRGGKRVYLGKYNNKRAALSAYATGAQYFYGKEARL